MYTIVCLAAQEGDKLYHEYVDMQKENVIFTHM